MAADSDPHPLISCRQLRRTVKEWAPHPVKAPARHFILFPLAGVKDNDTNQAACLPPQHWGSRLDLEQPLGETCCWASPSQGWSPRNKRQRNAESQMEREETQNREMYKNYLISKISLHQCKAGGVTFHSSLKIHVY